MSLRQIRSLVVAVVLVAACADSDTGVRLVVTFDPVHALDQIRVAATDAGRLAFTPEVVPRAPRALDGAGESVLILVPGDHADRELVLWVDGLAGGTPVASASQPVVPLAGSTLTVHVRLGALAYCGDGQVRWDLESCDDGARAAGDGCDDRCRDEDDDRDPIDPEGPDASPDPSPPPDAAPRSCDDSCGPGDCSLDCESCGCDLDCDASTGTCTTTCREGATCDVDCTDTNNCIHRCQNDAECNVVCAGANNCNVRCRNSSRCDIDCRGANDCDQIRCENAAGCLLRCGDGGSCRFEDCSGNETSCPGDIVVCNRACP